MGTGKRLLQKYKQEIVRVLKTGGNTDMMGHGGFVSYSEDSPIYNNIGFIV